eukprot:scaffold55068_cov33-Tisochrysis_lutea.AAC.2
MHRQRRIGTEHQTTEASREIRNRTRRQIREREQHPHEPPRIAHPGAYAHAAAPRNSEYPWGKPIGVAPTTRRPEPRRQSKSHQKARPTPPPTSGPK